MDERLVKVVTVNIYRNWTETFQTFDYITETGKFTWAERHASRIVGAVMMWAIAGAVSFPCCLYIRRVKHMDTASS